MGSEPNGALKLQSLNDLNGRGDTILHLIRQDDLKFVVTMTEGDLRFWRSRIDAVLLKYEEATNAKKDVSGRN